jgi:hypothetical protein
MYTSDEITRNLAGAWQVMNGRPAGLAQLDNSIEGFWRSFGAIVLSVPVLVLVLLSQDRIALDLEEPSGSVLPVPVQMSVWLVEWVLFPIVMAIVARPIGVASHYVPFIVARNWASVLIMAAYALPLLAYLAGIVPARGLLFIQFVILVVSGYFWFRIARTALLAPPGLAVAIVVADYGLSFMLYDVASAMVG